jgi:hypothetical protein
MCSWNGTQPSHSRTMTLGRERSNPVQAHDSVQHPKAGESAHLKERQKKCTGNKSIDGTELSYLFAAVTGLGHQGEGMVSQRSTTWREPCEASLNPIIVPKDTASIASSEARPMPSTGPYPTSIFRLRQPILNACDDHPSCPEWYLPSHILAWPHDRRGRHLMPTDGCPLDPHILQFRNAWPHHMGGASVVRPLLRSVH